MKLTCFICQLFIIFNILIHIIKSIGFICQNKDGWGTPIILIVPTFKNFFLVIYCEMPYFFGCILQSTVDSILITWNMYIWEITFCITLNSLETNSLMLSTGLSLCYRHARTAKLFLKKWNVYEMSMAYEVQGRITSIYILAKYCISSHNSHTFIFHCTKKKTPSYISYIKFLCVKENINKEWCH